MNINCFQRASSQGTSGKHSLDKSNSSVDNKSGGEMNGKNSLARDQSVTSIASTGLAVMRSKVSQDNKSGGEMNGKINNRIQHAYYLSTDYLQSKMQNADLGELILALRSRAAAIRNGQLASVIFMRTRIPKKLHVIALFTL